MAGTAKRVIQGIAGCVDLAGYVRDLGPATAWARPDGVGVLQGVGGCGFSGDPLAGPIRLAAADRHAAFRSVSRHLCRLVRPDVARMNHLVEPGDHAPEVVG